MEHNGSQVSSSVGKYSELKAAHRCNIVNNNGIVNFNYKCTAKIEGGAGGFSQNFDYTPTTLNGGYAHLVYKREFKTMKTL